MNDEIQSGFSRAMTRLYGSAWLKAIVVLVVVALCFAMVPVACTAPGRSRKALERAGYGEVRTGGYVWFACGSDDAFSTGFTATTPSGTPTSGVVCCGFFKGCTIRFD